MPVSAVSHVSLTVSDLARSKAWYAAVLGWDEQGSGRTDTTTYAFGLLGGALPIVLRQHDEQEASAFDVRRPGLDHLSFAVDRADLERIEAVLQAQGDDYTPTVEQPFGHQLTVRDPDGIALELIAAV